MNAHYKAVKLENVADVEFRQTMVILDIFRCPLKISSILVGRSLTCTNVLWSSLARAFFDVMLWDEFEVDLRRSHIFGTALKLMNGEDLRCGK